jgi:hypothetical protein
VEENLEEKECEQGISEKSFLKERETMGKTERELRDLNVQMLLSVQ